MCDLWLLIISLRGTIIETEKRTSIGKILCIRVIVGVVQTTITIIFICFIIYFSLTHQYSFPCDNCFHDSNFHLHHIFYFLVVLSQIADISGLLCCCYFFSTKRIETDTNSLYSNNNDEDSFAIENNKWQNFCRKIFHLVKFLNCSVWNQTINSNERSDSESVFEEVAKVLTNFFHHDGN